MRDTKRRIHPLLKRLAKAWETLPGLRLGQMIDNLGETHDIYNVEDEELIKLIEEYCRVAFDFNKESKP